MGFLKPDIQKLESEGNVQKLLKILKSRDDVLSEAAFHSLERLSDKNPAVMAALKSVINDLDPKLRVLTVLKIAKGNDDSAFSSLKTILINGAVKDRVEIVRILADYGEKNNLNIANILVIALKDKKDIVQLEAIKTMGRLQDPFYTGYIIEKLNDRMFNIRLEAARALGKIKSENSVDALIGALMDNSTDVRLAAKESLITIGTPEALTALNDAPFQIIMAKMNASVASREMTIQHIGKVKLKEGLPLIRKACFDEYKNIRLEALKALGVMRDRGGMSEIIKLLEDQYWDVRLEAVKTLERIADKTCLEALEKASSDQNKNVRDEAKKLYYAMKVRFEKLDES
jgi:HEAT repeat protein